MMQIHRVERGESIFGIARRYGISPAGIIESNGLENPDVLAVGQELLILNPRRVYTARAGDTVGGVSRRFNLKKEEIYAALSRDFDRVVFSISTRETNPTLAETDIRDVVYGRAEVWINPFDELYAEAKSCMPEFEFWRISSMRNREIIFATSPAQLIVA